MPLSTEPAPPIVPPRKQPFYATLWVQVTIAMALAVVLGALSPERAIAMKPLGDAFIRLITMIITLIIFCHRSLRHRRDAGHEEGRPSRRQGLAVFRSSLHNCALPWIAGRQSGSPRQRVQRERRQLDTKAVAEYAGQAKAQNVSDFLLHIIPTTIVDAFAKGDILQVLLVAILFGIALSSVGPRCKPVVDLFDALTHAVFGVSAS